MLETVMNLERTFDVLIVDDGSPDGTADCVRKLMAKYDGRIHLEERTGKLGLGTAYIHGFKWALARDTNTFLRWIVISPTILKTSRA